MKKSRDDSRLSRLDSRRHGASAACRGERIESMGNLLPAVFFGHGNPMNALSRNRYTEAWAELGRTIPRPKAVLSISAHWFVPQTGVTVSTAPKTIHDFGGFPRELYGVQYPAPGDPELAQRVRKLLAPTPVALDEGWGLDHGTWAVLRHVYPEADIPVVQLSIDENEPASFHYEIGERLAISPAQGRWKANIWSLNRR